MIKIDILLINDDLVTLSSLITKIEKFACNIQTANSAEDALIKVRHKKFDLGLINISSKAFDGCELIQQVKRIDPEINLVTITDRNSRGLELKIRNQGVLFYMIKPLNIKVLKDIVDYISKSKEKFKIESLQKFHNEWIGV